MKYAVSNIAWEPPRMEEMLGFLKERGCLGVEVAPSLLWREPVEASKQDREWFRDVVKRHDLLVTGFHALLFTRQDLSLFESPAAREKAVDYLRRLTDLCADVGGKVLIFGSPKNRAVGGRDPRASWDQAVEAFRAVADTAAERGICFCIEPLSPVETDFIVSSEQGWELVQAVNHPGFGLHLDAKAIVGSKEDPLVVLPKHAPHLRHFHVSDPDLLPPGTKVDHKPLGEGLRKGGYSGFVSLEMRRTAEDPKSMVGRSLEYLKQCYGGRP